MAGEKEWCDLACEATKDLPLGFENEEYVHCTLTRVRVDGAGAKLISKPEGEYVSLIFGEPTGLESEAQSEIRDLLSNEILRMSRENGVADGSAVLVAGLGNSLVTFDRLGPVACEKITPDGERVFVFCAEVEEKSGIKSGEAVKSIAALVGAGLVIAVDSLVARDSHRVQRVIQLSDSGISPGSGVGKHANSLDRATVGVPVIALGAPLASSSGDRLNVCADLLLASELLGEIIGGAVADFLNKFKPKSE